MPAVRAAARLRARFSRGMRGTGHSARRARSTSPFRAAWIDPDALRHLAEILLRNAIQATPSGGKILVRSSVQGDELFWSFSDTGEGIPAEAAHLFDPFYCGRQAGRGLGLGLPRAARIVEQAGGRLRWTSHPGQGTVFHINLPMPALRSSRGNQPAPSSRSTRNGERSSRGEPGTPQ